MPDRTFASRLGQLALALLNATLLLGVLLVFGLWLLLGRVQGFAADTARVAAEAVGEGLPAQVRDASGALSRLSALDARLAEVAASAGTGNGPAAAELAALRTEVRGLTDALNRLTASVGDLRGQSGAAMTDMLHQALLDLAGKLGPLTSPAPAAPAPPAN